MRIPRKSLPFLAALALLAAPSCIPGDGWLGVGARDYEPLEPGFSSTPTPTPEPGFSPRSGPWGWTVIERITDECGFISLEEDFDLINVGGGALLMVPTSSGGLVFDCTLAGQDYACEDIDEQYDLSQEGFPDTRLLLDLEHWGRFRDPEALDANMRWAVGCSGAYCSDIEQAFGTEFPCLMVERREAEAY